MPDQPKLSSTAAAAADKQKGVSFGTNTATADKTTERADIRKPKDMSSQAPTKSSSSSYGYSRSLSFAPADVSSKFILVLADGIQHCDSSFFETILDQLDMSIVVVCDEASRAPSEVAIKEIGAELELEADWVDVKWMKLPESAPSGVKSKDKATKPCKDLKCNNCQQCAEQQDNQLAQIKKLVSKFDCVAVLDAHLRWVQSASSDSEGDDDQMEGGPKKDAAVSRPHSKSRDNVADEPPPPSQLRDLACKLAIDTGATDMTDSPFWKIFR